MQVLCKQYINNIIIEILLYRRNVVKTKRNEMKSRLLQHRDVSRGLLQNKRRDFIHQNEYYLL